MMREQRMSLVMRPPGPACSRAAAALAKNVT